MTGLPIFARARCFLLGLWDFFDSISTPRSSPGDMIPFAMHRCLGILDRLPLLYLDDDGDVRPYV